MATPLVNKRVLITSGPTSVPVDDVRVITNRSTGEMGRLIANACAKAGARVSLLEGAVTTTVPLLKNISVRKFFLFDELDRLLDAELKKAPEVVIHAAAVSDFRPRKIFKGKIGSSDKQTIRLVPTKKLVVGIKKAAPGAFLVAFKLEPVMARALRGARRLATSSDCDLVVANVVSGGAYQALFVDRARAVRASASSKVEAVRKMLSLMGATVNNV
ncbi:MAG: phosphopantothenoylcysteine decarboxylase [Elusimicrobia bacterium]|nr:phosphopantothenoylcysteine decarboxylase [Elusimicrobiota bacterium]